MSEVIFAPAGYKVIGRDPETGGPIFEAIKKFGIFSSSTDPSKISKTVTGIIATIAGTLVMFLAYTGHSTIVPAPEVIDQAASQVGVSVGLIVQAAGLVYTAIGGLMKLVAFVGKRTQ